MGEKQMHPWSFFSLSGKKKLQNSTFLKIGPWNVCSRVFWHVDSDFGIFIKINWLLGGVSSFFQKSRTFSMARNLWWVRVNYWNLYIWYQLKSRFSSYIYLFQNPFFKNRFLEFWLQLSRVAPYLQFVTANCLNRNFLRFFFWLLLRIWESCPLLSTLLFTLKWLQICKKLIILIKQSFCVWSHS